MRRCQTTTIRRLTDAEKAKLEKLAEVLEPLWRLQDTATGEDVSIEWLEKHPEADAVLHSACAGDYTLTRRWFEENGMKFEDYVEMFRETGGHCDCTVYMNSLPILLRRNGDDRRR